MNVTLDGFMSGLDCELDWHFQYWNEEMARSASEQLGEADTILLGRITYSAMAKYWPSKGIGLCASREDADFADMMNNYRKIVFSKTLTGCAWNNSQLIKKNIAREINELKRQPGKNMIIYGSGKLVSALIKLGLIDEYLIWAHPLILGKGKPLFKNLRDRIDIRLCSAKTFSTGVVLLHYKIVNNF